MPAKDQDPKIPPRERTTLSEPLSRRQMLTRAGSWMLAPALCKTPFALVQRKRRQASQPAQEKLVWPISGASMYQDIITYYNFGDHRTGGKADLRTSDWIAAELRKTGFTTGFDSFSASQFFVERNTLTVAGKVIGSFPLWPPRPTRPEPIKAELAAYDPRKPRAAHGKVALLKFPFDTRASLSRGSAPFDLINAAARAGAVAAVAITEGPTGEIIALNSLPDLPPWPIPVLLAPARSEQQLLDAASQGADTTLLLTGRAVTNAEARNVFGRLHSGKKLVVVSTPQSGWFRCAAERGPGIALFLGLARYIARHQIDGSFLFVSTSGHELGQIGMEHFLRNLAPAPKSVAVWLHLGAGIATWNWTPGTPSGSTFHKVHEVDPHRFLMCSKDLPEVLAPIFENLPGLTPQTGLQVGEMELLLKQGYRSFAIAAAHHYHHTPADNPDLTAPELLEPVAGALLQAIESIQAEWA